MPNNSLDPVAGNSPNAHPIGALYGVILESREPATLAEFYRQILGGTIETDADDWVDLVLTSGLRLGFQHSPGHVAPQWPGSDGDIQAHLDIRVPSLEAAEAPLLAIGALPLEAHSGFRVYLDPAGHPFCTVR